MDNIIETVGEFGRFQKGVLVIVGLLSALSSATIFGTIFTAAQPDLNCFHIHDNGTVGDKVPDDASCQIWHNLKSNQTNQTLNMNHGCEFSKEFYNQTIISEWELICDNEYLAGLTQTIQIFGSIFGFYGG
jgi:hypothetical protein